MGELAELCANVDRIARDERHLARAFDRVESDRSLSLEQAMTAYVQMVETIGRARLLAAGFRQHDRGEWRKAG
jgi:hypothetical protein